MRLLHLLPFPPRRDAPHGGRRVAAELVRALAERHETAILFLRGDEPPLDSAVARCCTLAEEVRRSPLYPREGPDLRRRARLAWGLARGRPRWVSEWNVPEYGRHVHDLAARWAPDVVYVHVAIMGPYLRSLPSPRPRTILVGHEALAARAADELRLADGVRSRLARRLDLVAWRRFERRLLTGVDATVVFGERDRRALLELCPGADVEVIPFGVGVPDEAPDPAGEPGRLLFFGNFTHRPNVDAALRLARVIMPLVLEQEPTARLWLVGPAPPEEMSALAAGAVSVTGEVPDVLAYLRRANVFVAPLRSGGGQRVKVLEAMASGTAVVATSLAVEGLDVEDGRHFVRAESDEEFAQAAVALLREPDRVARIALEAREWARAHASWEAVAERYERLQELLLTSR